MLIFLTVEFHNFIHEIVLVFLQNFKFVFPASGTHYHVYSERICCDRTYEGAISRWLMLKPEADTPPKAEEMVRKVTARV